jgi:WD40 repeat protein
MKRPLPCTAIAFRPNHESFNTKNVFAASYADGSIRHWHTTSGKLLGTIQDNPDQTNHLTYRPDAQFFTTVGTDLQVRTYDAHTMKLVTVASYG